MKGLSTKTLTLILMCLLAFGWVSVLAGTPTEKHDANSMWIEPSSISFETATVSPGYRFNVTVYANVTHVVGASGAVGGWQFRIIYNKNYLKATGCWYTAGTKSQFFEDITTVSVSPSFGAYNLSLIHI